MSSIQFQLLHFEVQLEVNGIYLKWGIQLQPINWIHSLINSSISIYLTN